MDSDAHNQSFRKHIVALDQTCLVISDMHAPFYHQDTFAFLEYIKEKLKPDLVLNVGDEVDGHGISFHKSESGLPNPDKELEMAIEDMQRLSKLFPKMYLAESNHGSLAFRRIKDQGIPIRYLKSLPEIYETPLWSWHHEIMLETHIGNTLIVHGKSKAKNKLALEQGCNGIQGHYHGECGITWHRSSTAYRFNMFVGALADEKSLAQFYARNNIPKTIYAVGWLNELGEPSIIRMILDKNGRWIGKI